MKEGVIVALRDRVGGDSGYRLRLLSKFEREGGAWLVEPLREPDDGAPLPSDVGVLDQVGLTPLPPYIRAARKRRDIAGDERSDRERYQTVYARDANAARQQPARHDSPREVGVPTTGSVAAPTAGLHLTPELLATLAAMGVRRAEVVLHVGLGTFKPVETEFVEQHPMHHERCAIDPAVIELLRAVHAAPTASPASPASPARVICVGTTSARTVESYANAFASDPAQSAAAASMPPAWLDTNLLITPGYRWRWTQGLLTNFHLPKSTLLAMIASLLEPENPHTTSTTSEGLARTKQIYQQAITHRYRFYSFGDAMLIL
jgi:S-adenosylmethionine:tRNA ribosyltransferase-isomerase